jgi:hypothetical protein
MTELEHEKVHIERAITRARDGVSDRIDELDRRLRGALDVRAFAVEHAPQLVAGGAVVGFLVGFGFPKMLRRLVAVGLPLALVVMKVKSVRDAAAIAAFDPEL